MQLFGIRTWFFERTSNIRSTKADRIPNQVYSSGKKSVIFCFALLLPQILVNFQARCLSNSWSPNSILDSVFGLILLNEYYSFFRKIRFEYWIVVPVTILYFFLIIGANMQKNHIGTLLFPSKLLDLLLSKLWKHHKVNMPNKSIIWYFNIQKN